MLKINRDTKMNNDKEFLTEMPFTKTFVKDRILGLEYQINLHIIKIIYVNDPINLNHWQAELLTWLRKIARYRIKPKNITLKPSIYFELLYSGNYGGT